MCIECDIIQMCNKDGKCNEKKNQNRCYVYPKISEILWYDQVKNEHVLKRLKKNGKLWQILNNRRDNG